MVVMVATPLFFVLEIIRVITVIVVETVLKILRIVHVLMHRLVVQVDRLQQLQHKLVRVLITVREMDGMLKLVQSCRLLGQKEIQNMYVK